MLRHSQEGLLHVSRILSRGLQEGDSKTVGKLLCSSVLNLTLAGHVTLVADEELVDAFASVAVDFLEPGLDIVEGVGFGHVVDNDNTMGASVIARSDGPEAFLSSRVPLSII